MKTNQHVPIIILHGWAVTMTGARYKEVQQLLTKKGWTVYTPDLPGFGSEKLRKKAMSIDDYVLFVQEFLQKKRINKAIFIGHSFGGRIAAKFAATYPAQVHKLIICSAPLIKERLSSKKQIITIIAKIGKSTLSLFPSSLQQIARKLLYASIHEWDYYQAEGLRETFLRVIGEDLSPLLPTITTKTLIIWGENDTFVPLSQGRAIAGRIPHATLITVPNAGHKLPYEAPVQFVQSFEKYL